MSEPTGAYPSRLPNGEWRCIVDNRTEPCDECVGCREVQAINAEGREQTAVMILLPEQAARAVTMLRWKWWRPCWSKGYERGYLDAVREHAAARERK